MPYSDWRDRFYRDRLETPYSLKSWGRSPARASSRSEELNGYIPPSHPFQNPFFRNRTSVVRGGHPATTQQTWIATTSSSSIPPNFTSRIARRKMECDSVTTIFRPPP